MPGCTECRRYRSDYGPVDSIYCDAWKAKMSDNNDGSKEFVKYHSMGWKATDNCPKSSPDPDYL